MFFSHNGSRIGESTNPTVFRVTLGFLINKWYRTVFYDYCVHSCTIRVLSVGLLCCATPFAAVYGYTVLSAYALWFAAQQGLRNKLYFITDVPCIQCFGGAVSPSMI